MYFLIILSITAFALVSGEREVVPLNNLTISAIDSIPSIPFSQLGKLNTRQSCGSGQKECSLGDGCCDEDGACCGATSCCPAGSFCNSVAFSTCCDDGTTKCGSNDCYTPEDGEVCCKDDSIGGHCRKGETCCGLGCCPEGTHCEDDDCVKGNGAISQTLGRPWAAVCFAAWTIWFWVL